MSYEPPLAAILDTLETVTGADGLSLDACDPAADAALTRDILANGAKLVREKIAPLAARMDAEGCRFENGRVHVPRAFATIWSAYTEGGWLGLAVPAQDGGHGLPQLVQAAFSEMVCGASVPASMLPLLVRGAAAILSRDGDDASKAEYLPKLVDGRWGATISITEPDAGSDVSMLRTHAERDPAGDWRVSGTKMFISFGDHNLTEGILHMTLARTDVGLGLFAVPAYNDARRDGSVTPLRIEHKLGLMASPTCVMQFDRARAHPMGGPADGLSTIFTMINMMRLEVAVQGVGVASAATQAAFAYAGLRRQGRRAGKAVPIGEHPDVKRSLLTMRAFTDGGRALVFEAARHLDLAQSGRDPARRERASRLATFLLPVCKAGCAESAVAVTDLAIQIHGGHGYIRDTGIERLYRDARILPIYEGTTGIQAIDLLLRKMSGGGYEHFLAMIDVALAGASERTPRPLVLELRAARGAVEQCAAVLRSAIESDRDAALAAATPFLRLVFITALGWAWLRLAERARTDQEERYRCAAFFAEQMLPQAGLLCRQILTSGADWARSRPAFASLQVTDA